jgi:outer membrane lipoprotein carrier protein
MPRPVSALIVGSLLVFASGVFAQTPGTARPAAPPASPAPPTPGTGAPGSTALSLDEVVQALEKAYGKMADLRAEFSQTAYNRSLNQTIPAEGTVYLKRGGKLRWEFREPTPQEIVSDGKTLWVYTPTLNQVNVGAAPEALAGPAGSFLAGLGRLREHFTVRFLNPAEPRAADGTYVLDLTPKQPLPTLSRLILSVEPRQWEIRKAVVHDQFDNTVTMVFAKMTVNGGLADKLFTFVPPAGVATVPLK